MSATAGRIPSNGSSAFADRSDDAVAHLADATWAVSDYECAHVELPSVPTSPGQARRWAGGALPEGTLSAAEHDDVALLISELVTNAVRHPRLGAGETVIVRLAASRHCIRIEVSDHGAGFSPAPITRPAHDVPEGRGLLVIDAIASRWGTVCGDRHCVWAERDR